MKNKKILLSTGSSMFPLLLRDDLVFLKPIKKSQIKVDDIVVIELKNYYITHRVVYIDKFRRYLTTKGDNNLTPDQPVSLRKIAGHVDEVIRSEKKIQLEHLYLYQSGCYWEEIKKINSFFAGKRISYIFLKGLPTFFYYFKSHPRRIYADCDILINPGNLQIVDQAFTSLGYKRKDITLSLVLNRFIKNKAEVTYYKIIGRVLVNFDIHFEPVFFFVQTNHLSPLYPYQNVIEFRNLLLSEKKYVNILGEKYPLLGIENQIVYLALHLFHDNYRGYYKYELLEKVINSDGFDESKVVDLIHKYNLENFLYPSFVFLIKYYRPKLSKKFLSTIKPDKNKMKIFKKISKINIFEQEQHYLAGLRRFINIYYLSGVHPLIKPLIFLRPSIAALIVFTIFKKLSYIQWGKAFKLGFFLVLKQVNPQLAKKRLPRPAIADQNQPFR